MSKKSDEKGKKALMKTAKKEVLDKLTAAFGEYRNGHGNKKFDNKLRKATKLFVPFVVKGKPEIKKEEA